VVVGVVVVVVVVVRIGSVEGTETVVLVAAAGADTLGGKTTQLATIPTATPTATTPMKRRNDITASSPQT